MAAGLDQMIFEGSFQPKRISDSPITKLILLVEKLLKPAGAAGNRNTW